MGLLSPCAQVLFLSSPASKRSPGAPPVHTGEVETVGLDLRKKRVQAPALLLWCRTWGQAAEARGASAASSVKWASSSTNLTGSV